MTDLLFPPHARISAEQLTNISNAASARSIFTGASRSTSRSGGRLRYGITTENASTREDYRNDLVLQSFAVDMDGVANRCWFGDPAYTRRGSFPASELVLNPKFSDGTTNWTAGAGAALSVTDRVMRVTRASSTFFPGISQSGIGVTQYAPYVLRAMLLNGVGSQNPIAVVQNGTNTVLGSGPGLATAAIVAPATTLEVFALDGIATGAVAGDYFEVSYISLSRCALVDGGVNLLLRSEEFDDAAWVKSAATVTANAGASPDGITSADALVDNATSTSHYVEQGVTVSSSAGDFCVSIAVKASARNFACLEMRTSTGAVNAFVDLTSGAATAPNLTGAFSNARVPAPRDLGNGWWHVSVVARKTDAATTLTARVYSANSNSSTIYSGSSTSAILMWRATMSASGVSQRLKQTSGSGSTGETQSSRVLRIKGMPPSTNNLLILGDRVQVGSQYNFVAAPLNSDSLGLGTLQCARPWRVNPADNAPLIIHEPMGRFMMTSNEVGWDQQPGGTSNYQFEIEEALDA